MITQFRKTAALVAGLCALGALTTTGAAGAAERPGPEGIWQVDDYGTVLAVHGGALDTYQVTSVSCLKGVTGTRDKDTPARYAMADGDVYTLRTGVRARLHIDGSPGDRSLRRLTALPATCRAPQPGAFDVFWQTFQENYPFFAAKGIDWKEVRDRYRPRAEAARTDAELYAILTEMVAPLHDAHVVVSADKTGFFGMTRPGTVVPGPGLDTKVRAFVERRDLKGRSLRPYANGRIGYADVPAPGGGNYGYLRLSAFSGYTETNTYAANRAELDRAVDAILTPDRAHRLRGLILDVRVNGGGSDSLGLDLAARLTDRPYFAYAKRTRHTAPQPQHVRPAAATRYAGPVALLTGGSTFSAGETFTQAMMERPAPTTRIGEPTQGVFSDVMERALPGEGHDKWWFGLPNEEFLTRDGRTTFDGVGVPPLLPEPVFTDAEFAHDRDSAFDRAVGWLGERGR
ncbi:S41 family peptidase [Streptomyces melanogenes]|uniref:S41 family peptidase n=1 Tax=Streptomyces melanogenes TaxID=67326 RepID=UPI0037AE8314